MLDHHLNPFLIEINQMPSFATDSPLDKKIKHKMLFDCMRTLCLSVERRNEYKQ